MNGTRDRDETGMADEERGLDPREAANLLEQTRRQASRGFDDRTPALSLLGAVVVLVAALVGVSVFQGVLKADGVSLAIVYGIYPPTAQLIVMGAIGASVAAGRVDWPGFGVAIAIIAVATASAFAGPVGVWLWDGIGCALSGLGYSAAQAWVARR